MVAIKEHARASWEARASKEELLEWAWQQWRDSHNASWPTKRFRVAGLPYGTALMTENSATTAMRREAARLGISPSQVKVEEAIPERPQNASPEDHRAQSLGKCPTCGALPGIACRQGKRKILAPHVGRRTVESVGPKQGALC